MPRKTKQITEERITMSENESSSVSINPLSLHDLKKMKIEGLTDLAKQYDVENPAGLKRQDLIFAIIKAHADKNGQINADGVLEILPDGFGFIRSPNYSYLPVQTTYMYPHHR